MTQADIVKNAIRRFHHLPNLTIAKHILNTHGDLFEQDLEKIRSRVRYWTGRTGQGNRNKVGDKSLFKTGVSKIPKTWRKTRTPYKLPPGLWLAMADLHVPFHEPKPIETAIKYGQAEGVDGIFILGDLQDCAAVSYWPTAHRDFNSEIEATIDFFDFLANEFPGKPIVYKPGNHEYRLPRYFLSKAPELVETPLAAMETVLGFEERGIEFLDYFQLVYAGKLPMLHGHEVQAISRAVNPARGLFLRTKQYALCAHCHTTSEHSASTVENKLITTWSIGCLCDLSPDYRPFANDWNWGCALINVEKDGDFEVVNKRILPSGELR